MRGCTCRGLTLCPQCAQLAARAGVIPPLRDSAHQLSEKAFMQAVVRLAREQKYLVYHTQNSKRSPSGFPDLIAVHHLAGRPLLAIELKTDTGQVTKAQAAWLEALGGCTGVVAEVWKPSGLEEICRKLKG